MSEIMNNIYYMMVEQVGQRCARETEMKILIRRKCALMDEIALRIGDGGEELLEAMTNLDADLENIQGKAMFRAAVRLGAELAGSTPQPNGAPT